MHLGAHGKVEWLVKFTPKLEKKGKKKTGLMLVRYFICLHKTFFRRLTSLYGELKAVFFPPPIFGDGDLPIIEVDGYTVKLSTRSVIPSWMKPPSVLYA